MSINISVSQVKEKCGLVDTAYDTEIGNLINLTVPAIAATIRPEFLDPAADANLVALINLGALELVSGEFFAQLTRKPGLFDAVQIGNLSVRPFIQGGMSDPSGLKAQGTNRLAPYVLKNLTKPGPTDIYIAGGKQGGDPS